jgi:hypothetical protein
VHVAHAPILDGELELKPEDGGWSQALRLEGCKRARPVRHRQASASKSTSTFSRSGRRAQAGLWIAWACENGRVYQVLVSSEMSCDLSHSWSTSRAEAPTSTDSPSFILAPCRW